jgi:hypothetical protein
MRRALALALVVATALVVAAPTAGAAAPRRGLSFELHAGGFVIQGESPVGSGRMRLLLDRHGEVAYYYTAAQVGTGTVKVDFGRLGSLDLRFVPARGEGSVGCGGSEGLQRGTFVGSFVFHGENDYAQVDARRAPGWFETEGGGRCGSGQRGDAASLDRAPAAVARISAKETSAPRKRIGEVAETGAELEGAVGSRQSGRFFYFSTIARPGGDRVSFDAFRYEHREGVLVYRGAQVFGGARRFVWDLGMGTARAEPPAPFSGRATYRRGADRRRPSWTSSLRVPILGGKPMWLTGAAFRVHLGRGT